MVLARFPLAGGQAAGRTMVGAMLVRDGRVLLGLRRRDRRVAPAVWDVPGGHVEPGESPRTALRRELREELGIEAELAGPLRRLVDPALGATLWLWAVHHWAGAPRNAAPDEHDELRWFRPDELGALPLAHASYPNLAEEAVRSGDKGLYRGAGLP